MQGQENRGRLLAPAALVMFGLIFFIIIFTSGGGGGNTVRQSGVQKKSAQGQSSSKRQRVSTVSTTTAGSLATTTETNGNPERVYVVRSGDNLSSIAESTGVPITKIEELNPDVDPRALVTGQKIKLR